MRRRKFANCPHERGSGCANSKVVVPVTNVRYADRGQLYNGERDGNLHGWLDAIGHAELVSTNTSVASVDQNGVVRGVAAGVVTVTASISGVSATLSARSIPNYAGRWSGQYRFISCSAPPRWGQSYCAGLVGTLFNIELNLGQTTADVTGSIRMGSFVGSVNGPIAEDGTLSLRGRYTASAPSGLVYIFDIRTWQTRSANGSTMPGRWDSVGSLSGETQTGFEEYEMISVTKS